MCHYMAAFAIFYIDVHLTAVFSSYFYSSSRRWEVQIVDILPQDAMAQIKKARAARKKVGAQFNALGKFYCHYLKRFS